MLKNYFKIAIAVFKRRKFFTFISLFGISFTLTILIVITSLLQHLFGSTYPEANRERSLYIEVIKEKADNGDTRNNVPSFYFLNTYMKPMKTPVKKAICSHYVTTMSILKNKKMTLNVKYTNGDYWDVMEYKFLEGKSYDAKHIEHGDKVAVITENTRKAYFGELGFVVGKYIESDHEQYKVIGVVKDVAASMMLTYADMYVPFTANGSYRNDKGIQGYKNPYHAILLAESKEDIPKIQSEYASIIAKLPILDKYYTKIFSVADPYLVIFTREIAGDNENNGLSKFYSIAFLILSVFILLPILNLINMNTSRVMERASEIGVRKAFGASSNTLVIQFLVENILLTFMGGIISILLSYLIIYVSNSVELVPHAVFTIEWSILLYSLLTFFLFGILSGVYPAWRMSRMNVVHALKAS